MLLLSTPDSAHLEIVDDMIVSFRLTEDAPSLPLDPSLPITWLLKIHPIKHILHTLLTEQFNTST